MRRLTSQHWRWLVILALAAVVLGLSACSTPQTTFAPKSDAAERTHAVYILLTVMASLVGAGVLVAMVYIMVRFRARPGRTASQTHGHTLLEIIWTVIPVSILVLITIPSVMVLAQQYRAPDPDALRITVTGHQWWWEFEYEGLGPDGGTLVTANELHLPVGRQVSLTLKSKDVIHSFWVPQLVGKTDSIPGRTNVLEPFTPKEVGTYYGQCAEFCGSAHALMRTRAIVEPLAEFEKWVAALQTPPAPTGGLAAQGQQLFFGAAGCIACHTIAGTAAQGKVGPNLTRYGSRLTTGAGILENNDENTAAWIYDLRSLKPVGEGALVMPSFGELSASDPRRLSRQDTEAIAAYLRGMRVE